MNYIHRRTSSICALYVTNLQEMESSCLGQWGVGGDVWRVVTWCYSWRLDACCLSNSGSVPIAAWYFRYEHYVGSCHDFAWRFNALVARTLQRWHCCNTATNTHTHTHTHTYIHTYIHIHTNMPSGETRQPDNRMTTGRKENKQTRSDNREYASGRYNTAQRMKRERTV